MDKTTQDLAWASLPKEAREEMKGDYSQEAEDYMDKGYNLALRAFFGHHNLTSGTEPEEMLMVERKKVVEEHKCHMGSNEYGLGYTDALEELFGDKCLPDKEPEHRLEQASVQVEPKYKFSLGQKVILHFHGGEKGTISERLPPQVGSVWNCYKVKELPHHLWRENELDLYTEPEPKDTKLSTDASKLSTLDPKLSTETKDNMEGKKQFDLYVKGNIISNGKLSLDGESGYVVSVPEVEVDLSHGLIVEGDMAVDGLYIYGMKVACSGSLYAR